MTGCNTIKLGTLEHYQEYDDPESLIGDSEEGIDAIDVVSFHSNTASKEAKEALRPIIPKDYPNIIIDHCQWEYEIPNCFIYCCSKSTYPISPEQGTRMNENYTSHFEIVDRLGFGKQLMDLLFQCLSGRFSSSIPKDVIPGLSLSQRREQVRVNMIHAEVAYVDKKKTEIKKGELHQYAGDIPKEYRPLFSKAKKYEDQQEYRYVFHIVNKLNNQILPVRREPLILPLDPIAQHFLKETLGEKK